MPTTLAKWDGLGVANGTTMTTSLVGTGDTAANAILGTAPTVDQTNKIGGGAVLDITQVASTACSVTWLLTGGARAVAEFGFYLFMPAAWTSSAFVFFQGLLSATPGFRVNIAGTGTPGEIRLTTGNSTAIGVSGASHIANSTGYWCVVSVNLGASPQQLRLQVWDMSASSIYDSTTLTNVTVGTTVDRFSLGNPATTPTVGAIRYGRPIAVDTIGTLGSAPPTLGTSGDAATTITATITAAAAVARNIDAPTTITATIAAAAANGGAAAASAVTATLTAAAAVSRTAAAALTVTAGRAVGTRFDWMQDFDSTPNDIPFDTNAGVTAPTVTTLAVHDGTNGLRVGPSTSAAVRGKWSEGASFPTNMPYWAFSCWFRIPTLPTSTDLAGSGANIVDARNDTLVGGTGQGHFQTFYRAAPNNDLAWDLLAANAGVSSMKMAAGAWHYLQCKGFYGSTTYTADVQIDGIPQTSIASSGVNPFFLGSIGVGSEGTTQNYSYDVDTFLNAASEDPLPFLGSFNPDAALALTATLTADTAANRPITAASTVTAALTAVEAVSRSAAATTTITATLAADASVTHAGGVDAATTITATVTAAVTVSRPADTATTVTVTLTAAITVNSPAAGAQTVTAALTAAITVVRNATATTSVTASITAAASGGVVTTPGLVTFVTVPSPSIALTKVPAPTIQLVGG